MTFLALALLAAGLLGLTCWASNIWPGHETWTRAALARLIWWAVPFAFIVRLNGAPWLNATVLGVAAWAGAFIPHTEYPEVSAHWRMMALEMLIVISRVAAVLAPPGAVFWLCGAYWPAMLLAAAAILPCMYAALLLPHRWSGLRTEREVAGVLFGVATGFCLAIAVWTPDSSPDLLP